MIAAGILLQQAQMPKMNANLSSDSGASGHSKSAFEQLLNESQLLSSQSKTGNSNEQGLGGDREEKDSFTAEMLLEKLQTAFTQMAQKEEDAVSRVSEKTRDFVTVLEEQLPSQMEDGRETEKFATTNGYSDAAASEIQQSADGSEKAIPANLTEVTKWLEQASAAKKQIVVPQLSEKTTELMQRMVSATSNAESKPISLFKNEWADRKLNYQTDTKLTSKAMAALLEQELGPKAKPEIGMAMQTQNDLSTGTWMPKLEQFVIHLNHSQGNASPDQQFIEQFQKMIQSSKFLNAPAGGANQLSITLHPSNLGEMSLRFAEVNGEMTVKILVTTQVAKDMLEMNMKQLRNMFSPHQVMVEKQEMAVSQGDNIDAQEQQEEQDEKEERYFHQLDEQEEQPTEMDFESQLNEVLLNEKV